MCRVPTDIQPLLLGLYLVDTGGIDFGRFAEREWLSKDDAPCGVSLKAVVGQLPRSHLEARLAAAIASDAFE
jgi:hypothetical protein